MTGWLEIQPGTAPLIVSIPHAGTEIPEQYQPALTSLWLARKDADWWLQQLYSFAEDLGATIIRTHISRTVIDVNRDPGGVSLYPGQATTELCPTTTFDGEPLYQEGQLPFDIEDRKAKFFNPYHEAIETEIARLKERHSKIVIYDCHSIRSRIPRLFEGELPNFNIGTNDNISCAPEITDTVTSLCAANQFFSHVLNGRFKGGYITRHHSNQSAGIHTIQMELACRGYMPEPETPNPANWPPQFDPDFASPIIKTLRKILESFIP
jgi:N-formylglutamate deformylase